MFAAAANGKRDTVQYLLGCDYALQEADAAAKQQQAEAQAAKAECERLKCEQSALAGGEMVVVQRMASELQAAFPGLPLEGGPFTPPPQVQLGIRALRAAQGYFHS